MITASKLTLDIPKSHHVIFSRKPVIHNTPPIYIENSIIEKKNDTKFLGVQLDSSLNWNYHILNIKAN